jgi:uncharacterized protein (TIGR00661 family)
MIKKQNIVIGVCGFGKGHTVRQKNIIENLSKRGHRILLFLTEHNKAFFDNAFPQIDSHIVHIPWIYADKTGVQFEKTRRRYIKDGQDWYLEQLKAFTFASKYFNGSVDSVISDYEPNSAQLAYAVGCPLICLEQQSKFLGFNTPRLGNYSRQEEAKRLNYFFPYADKRIVSSFFKIPGEKIDSSLEVIPPIIDSSLKKLKVETGKVLVYFSPYNSKYEKFPQILKKLSNFPGYKFHIYSTDSYEEYKDREEFIFKKITDSNRFMNDLRTSNFVISTAGHQLISESIWYDKPLFLIPFKTYEQKFNAYMVEEKKLGEIIEDKSLNEIRKAFNKQIQYKQNIKIYKEEYWNQQWDEKFFQILERDFSI